MICHLGTNVTKKYKNALCGQYSLRGNRMIARNDFAFPQDKNLEFIKTVYAGINGEDSFETARQWQSETWSVEAHRSKGVVLEKAGLGLVHLKGGTVDGVPTAITLLQSMAYPANPCLPGCIVMASTSRMEDQDPIMMVYVDLIDQNGRLADKEKKLFSAALATVCQKHNRGLEEYQAFMTGRSMLGACAAECGMLYFFEASDVAFLEESIATVLKTYQAMVIGSNCSEPTSEDRAAMKQRRKDMISWMLEEDYGTKVARENNIDMEAIEMYGFPPQKKAQSLS